MPGTMLQALDTNNLVLTHTRRQTQEVGTVSILIKGVENQAEVFNSLKIGKANSGLKPRLSCALNHYSGLKPNVVFGLEHRVSV